MTNLHEGVGLAGYVTSRAGSLPGLRSGKREKSNMAGGKTQELKGRAKEAAGALTGDAKLKREGRLDQTAGKAKQTAEKVIDKVKDAVK
jgi:uncharacterized protein YjbJ (UPF0337 family)